VAVTVQAADRGDTQTVRETLCEAGEQVATVAGEAKSEGVNPEGPKEVVLDKGYQEQPTRLRILRGASPRAINCLYSDG